MIKNKANRFLRAPATDEPATDVREQGLSAHLEKYLATNPTGTAEPVVAAAPPVVQSKPVEAAPEPVVAAVAEPVVAAAEEEEEFPEIGKPVEAKAASDFNEAEFDAQTEAEAKGMEPKAGEKFKALKAQLKETLKENATLKTQPAPTTAVPKEVEAELVELRQVKVEAEALRQRNAELLRVNDEVAVKESPEFIAAVVKPIQEMTSIIASMAEAAGVDPKLISAIIEETDVVKQDKMIEAMEVKLGRRSAGRLERLADDYKAIVHKEVELLQNAPKTIAESRQARELEKQREVAARTEQFKASTRESFEAYAKRVPGFTDSSGVLTDAAKVVLAQSEEINPNELTPHDLGFMTFSTKALPVLRKALVEAQKEIVLLKAGKSTSATLSAGSPSGTPEPTPADPNGVPQGLLERMKGKQFTLNGQTV